MPDLLLELFSEEIPARMQSKAADDLKRLVTDALVEAGLTYASAGAFSTPRRLTLTIEDLLAASPKTREERRGPRVDAPQKAIEGFLRGAGVSKDDLEVRPDKKGEVYFAVIEKPGRAAEEIIAEIVPAIVREFPWPKSMRWGAGSLRWVRPLQSVLCILSDEAGTQTVDFDIDGIVSGNQTQGHRFMAPDVFEVHSFADYETKLSKAKVVLSAEARSQTIWHDATQLAFAAGLEVVEDKGLLAEVAGLVEFPVVLMGDIDDDFLGLPPEVLQTSMREHQKFFSVRNPATGRVEKFITVANRETADHGATILAGNQKVLSARLSDAKFFWDNDLRIAKAGMDVWQEALASVTFERRLGSVADRVERIAVLAREIAPQVGADPDQAEAAARIAKADLHSEMVYEFPELQGVMGRYYAEAAGHPPEVAAVAQEHYQPLGPSDAVPTAPLSVAVSLAEKLDTLIGFWAIDEKPTGSKDPFALRRAALGVVRMVLENGLRLGLFDLLVISLTAHRLELAQTNRLGTLRKLGSHDRGYEPAEGETFLTVVGFNPDPVEWKFDADAFARACDADHVYRSITFPEPQTQEMFEPYRFDLQTIVSDLLAFFHDRLKVHLRNESIRHDIIDAALARPPADDLALVVARARALAAFLATPDGENLVQGYRRAANILAQAEEKDGVEYRFGPDVKFAETDAERALFAALKTAQAAIVPALQQADFEAAMTQMAALRAPIDAFFEALQVNADNQIVRRNRLNLLHKIVETCGQVADLSKLDG